MRARRVGALLLLAVLALAALASRLDLDDDDDSSVLDELLAIEEEAERGGLDAEGAGEAVRRAQSMVEFAGILAAVENNRRNEEGAFRRIWRREYRPYLVMAMAFSVFLNLTGVAITAFFSPILSAAGEWEEMGLTFTKLFSRLFTKKEMRILMVGLDAAGKTTTT